MPDKSPATGAGPKNPPSRRSHLLWICLIWLFAGLYFWPALFEGKSFYFRDASSMYYPHHSLVLRAWQAGELPLWEPRFGLGYPFHADPHSLTLYPLSLLWHLPLDPRWFDCFIIFHLPLAGTALFLLLRRWALSIPAALLGAATLMFSGHTVGITMMAMMLRGTCWIPVVLLAHDRYLDSGTWRAASLTCLAISLQASGSDPQYVLFSGVLLLLLPWLRPGGGPSSAVHHFLSLVFCSVLASGVAAYQYLPLAQLASLSSRSEGLEQSERTAFDVPLATLPNLVVPVPFPDPATPAYLSSFPEGKIPFLPDIYLGFPLLVLALAAMALAARPRRDGGEDPSLKGRDPPRDWSAVRTVCLGLFGAVMALGSQAPLLGWIETLLPPLTAFRYPGKYLVVTVLAVAIAAARSLDAITRGNRSVLRFCCRLLELSAALCAASLVSLSVLGLGVPGAYLSQLREQPPPKFPEILQGLLDTWTTDLTFALILIVTIRLLYWLGATGKLGWQGVARISVLFILLDLTASTRRSSPVTEDVFLTAPPIATRWVGEPQAGQPLPRYAAYFPKEYVISDGGTVLDQLAMDKQLMAHFWGTLSDRSALLVVMPVRLRTESRLEQLFGEISWADKDRVVAALGGQWVVRPGNPAGEEPHRRILGGVGPVIVEELPRVSPRAFIPPRALGDREADEELALEELLQLTASVRFEAADGVPASLSPGQVRKCDIVNYTRNRVEMEVDLIGEGMLVLLDGHYPGWKAGVDGEPRPVVRVAGLFRGVPVREGDRKVTMTYEPVMLYRGLAVSALSLLILAGMFLLGARRPFRPS